MTTIVLIRKNNELVVAGDGQVSMGNTVIKSTAAKVRKIDKRNVTFLLKVYLVYLSLEYDHNQSLPQYYFCNYLSQFAYLLLNLSFD